MHDRRHHVRGQRLCEPLPHGAGRHGPRAGTERHQLRPAHDDHRAVPHPVHPQQRVLDLADLDAEPADLHLAVPAPEELQLPVRTPAPVVPAAVQPLTGPVRVLGERRLRPLGVVDVPPAHAHTGEHDLAGRAQRHGHQVLVDDVHPHIGDGPAERDAVAVRCPVHHLVVGVVRSLRQAIGVDEPHPGPRGEPAVHQLLLHGLPGDRHAAQIRESARLPLQLGEHGLQIRRHDLEDVHAPRLDRVGEPCHVQDHVLLHQQRPPAHERRADQLPQGDVEALRRGLRHHLPGADPQVVELGEHMVEETRVLAHRALGLTRGARREVDVGQLTRRDRDAEVAVRVALGVHLVDVERPVGRVAE